MPIWGWLCIGLTVAAVSFIVFLNVLTVRQKNYTVACGEATHGWLVHAHTNIFSEGNMNEAGLVVVSPDSKTNNDEKFMSDLAERIMALKGEDGDTKSEQIVAELMEDETYISGHWSELPAEFTDGKRVFLVHIMIFRDHLPETKLVERKVPCAIVWDEPGKMVCSRPVKSSKRRRNKTDEE